MFNFLLRIILLLNYLYIKMMKFFIIFERFFINDFWVIMGNCLNDMIFFIVLEFGIGML